MQFASYFATGVAVPDPLDLLAPLRSPIEKLQGNRCETPPTPTETGDYRTARMATLMADTDVS
jgi:hypothetical protein